MTKTIATSPEPGDENVPSTDAAVKRIDETLKTKEQEIMHV